MSNIAEQKEDHFIVECEVQHQPVYLSQLDDGTGVPRFCTQKKEATRYTIGLHQIARIVARYQPKIILDVEEMVMPAEDSDFSPSISGYGKV